MGSGRGSKLLMGALALVLVTGLIPTSSSADVLNGAVDAVLARESQVNPENLGDGAFDGLQHADPTEGIDLVDPPVANNHGSADLTHPLSVPAGRGGMQPDLALSYSSDVGTTWLGTGWDLSVGAVTVDTRWGVPRYLQDKESETYQLDGQVLSPTAVRSELEDRVTNRSDYTRRIETQHERIVRHGQGPGEYWWEVTDKSGTSRYYGGTPETGRQTDAILGDSDGNEFRWALTQQRDISGNTINYFYAKEDGRNVGEEGSTIGVQFYLERITYTGTVADGVPDDPAYQILFLRDGDLQETPESRRDVDVSARGGFLEVTADLLRRIEVYYGDPNNGDPRTYDTLVRRFDLNYMTGAFGKTLLASVDQRGSDGAVFANHEFDYFDDVRDGNEYQGFTDEQGWSVDDDGIDRFLLDFVDASILGASETFAGDGHGYLGFNLLAGKKTGSVGGAISVNGGVTESFAEMLDINGDGLPDKVFREDGDVVFRLNTSGPDGSQTFADETHEVDGIDRLSTEWDVGLAGGPEAHLGVSVQFSAGASVSVGEEYFVDVNNDGLPDFVSGGTVHFNHLSEVNGQLIPTFTTDSANTAVPVDDGTIDLPEIEALTELEARQRAESPLFDTVRRWVAPYAGSVTIDAPVTFDPPPRGGFGTTAGDGVRVAIQHEGTELWSDIVNDSVPEAESNLGALEVEQGDAIYFRLQSIDDGARDRVIWDPTITYTSFEEGEEISDDYPPLDVNGLSQTDFNASDDFTLAGRPGTLIGMPLQGTVRFETDLRMTKPLTDDLTVQIIHNGDIVFEREIVGAQGDPDEVFSLEHDFEVDAPTADTVDEVQVRIAVDSPIDVTAIEWEPRLYYIEAVSSGEPVEVFDPDGKPLLELFIPPDIDIYPNNSLDAPVAPWTAETTEDVTIDAAIGTRDIPFEIIEGEIMLTVKQRDGLVAKETITINDDGLVWEFPDIDLGVTEGEQYWFDVSVQDPDLAEVIVAGSLDVDGVVTRVVGDPPVEVRVPIDLPSTVHWSGRQGIFPLAYRGWAYAGYNGDGDRASEPIDEGAFVLEFDEDDFPTDEPDGFDDEDYRNPMDGDSYPYTPYRLKVDDSTTVLVWRGLKDNQIGGAGFASASRQGVDSPGVFDQAGAGVGIRAPRRVGITAPNFSVSGGIGPLSGSLAASPSWGLVEYTDLNGDGFPDIVAPGSVDYTGPRGGYFDDGDFGDSDLDRIRQDTTFSVSAGFAGSPIAINGNSKGEANTAQDTAATSGTAESESSSEASQGGPASDDSYGFDIGGSVGVTGSLTNPSAPDESWSDGLDAMPDELQIGLEEDIADVNGDGLPDKVKVTPGGVTVRFNLGYGFSEEIDWAPGGLESGISISGSVGATLGFQIGNKAFSGGLSYNESVDMPLVSWVDLDGDGILDQLVKPPFGDISVRFGSGSGLLPEVDYGSFVEGEYELSGIGDLPGVPGIPTGEQIAQSRSRGLGGGVDFTIGIGPLCIKACYLIINPGAHLGHSISTTQVQITDVDGDGYPDSVFSTEDDELQVRLNNRGRTNLLASVANPLGGEIRLDYERKGNTVEQPHSQWVLASVEVDDNRPGDGPDTRLTTYEYSDNRFDPLERELLGYETVVEHQRDPSAGPDDAPIRSIERRYRNATVFESGLLVSETLLDGEGSKIKGTNTEWTLIDLATGEPAVLESDTDPAGIRLLQMAVAPRRTKIEPVWYNADGTIAKSTWNAYRYDDLGNVIHQLDVGEPELPDDDITAVTTYSDCRESSWVSLPATFVVTDAEGQILRQRDGSDDLCANGAVTHLVETIDDGTTASTDLEFDAWGNYDRIAYPKDADGERLVVEYVYDEDRHTDIAHVVDSHGLTSTATYDGRTGRLVSRTDANNQTTSYTYDTVGRVASITGPYQQGTDTATVAFEYHPTNEQYAYAVAHHHDMFNPGDDIDTATFVDGIGRETQTKHDATVFRGVDAQPEDVVAVSGAVEFDALGRPVKEWHPIEEPLGDIGTYNLATSDTGPTTTTWTLTDLLSRVVTPSGAVTETGYAYVRDPELGATLFETTRTDPEGKPQRTYTDVRGLVHAIDDMPIGAPMVRTRYFHDALGQLVGVVDSAGNETEHTYDRMGRRTSTTTPDGGLNQWLWDPAGNLVGEVDPKLRAAGTQITYKYDIDRLVAVDYPDDTPDVSYTYGEMGVADNGAGRVIALEDGARSQTLRYDPLGEVDGETTTMLVHNLNDGTEERLTFTTEMTFDAFGRLATLVYPDGELLTHDYDSGGLLESVAGEKASHAYPYLDRREYDVFGDRNFQQTGNGVQTVYRYDSLTRRLNRQVTETPDREVQDLNYTYDRVGNVLEMDNRLPRPKPSLKGGPSTQTYTYDPYHRLESAEGTYSWHPKKRRDYTFMNGYDQHGNVVVKNQTDHIFQGGGGKGIEQKPTTYSLDLQYGGAGPHQITQIGTRSYTYDLNGNFTGWDDDVTGQLRAVTWDAAGRVRSVADQGSTTRYTYDDAGRLGIERGPSGETSFVNQWYTVRNGAVAWKHIWAGEDRLATQRAFNDGVYEHMRYFLHKDLQGSSNIITDDDGLVFQHLEYFPSGEVWVHEKGDEHRTPYLYTGGYFDEFRDLVNLGDRWYEPREQFLYSTDPILVDEPNQVVDDPALLPAYTYAESNPLRMIDLDGRDPDSARARLGATFMGTHRTRPALAAAAAGQGGSIAGQMTISAGESAIPASRASRLRQGGENIATSLGPRVKSFSELFSAKPLVEINMVKTGDGWSLENVKVSPTMFLKQFKVIKGKGAETTDAPGGAPPPPAVASPPTAGPGSVPGPVPPGGVGAGARGSVDSSQDGASAAGDSNPRPQSGAP